MSNREWPDSYSRTERPDEPNWTWLSLWEESNPNPGGDDDDDFDDWYAERQKVHARVWVAWCLPQFQVFDWSDEDVAVARKLVAGHVCSVCGRPDDAGCVLGC